MRAGALKSRITFYSKAVGKDSYGASTEGYTEVFSVRAEVRYLKGAELMMSSTIVNTTTLQFIIRPRGGITEEMEIEYKGDRYNIQVIEVSGIMMKLTASKIVN